MAQNDWPQRPGARNVSEKHIDEKLVERIRKILAKTVEGGCSPDEAAAAVALAGRLLVEYNLSMDDIHLKGEDSADAFIEEGIFETGRWMMEHNLAYHVVKSFFFVHGFFGGGASRKNLYLFGTETNVATARHVFTSLLASADRLWTTYRKLNRLPASDRRSYVSGVMKGYYDKLKEERDLLKMERDILRGGSGGTALAICRVEDQLIQKFRETKPGYTKERNATFTSLRGSQSTLAAGYEAGKNLNLNRALGTATRKGIEGQ
jgi:hypothetical protein